MTKSKRQTEELVATASGIFLQRSGMPSRRVARPIRIRATVAVQGMVNRFIAVDFRDYDGQPVSLKLPRADFLTFHKFRHALEDAGYEFPADNDLSKRLHKLLVSLPPAERWEIVNQVGWHGDHFVRSNTSVRAEGRILRFESDKLEYYTRYERRGTLPDWQKHVAEHAVCSSRLLFAISLAFAAPLIRFSDVESGGFHLYGPSTKGKTTCLIAAMSVVGPSVRSELKNWDITDAGLEEVAAGHNDSLLCLDEVGQIRTDAATSIAKKLRTDAFKLAGGRGRLRSSLWGHKLAARELRWRLLFLSTGEHALSELASQAEIQRLKGEEVRLIDLPAIINPELGIYDRLPDEVSTVDEALTQLANKCEVHYGVAFEAFVDKVRANLGVMNKAVQRRIDDFMKAVQVPNDAWERRFARRFALAFAAGAIAADFGIVPWGRKTIGLAIKACYLAARAAVPDADKLREDGLTRLRTQLSGAANILDLVRRGHKVGWSREAAAAAEAFRVEGPNGRYFLVSKAILARWLVSPLQINLTIDELERRNYLIQTDSNVKTEQHAIWGIPGRPRYYAIREAIITSA